MVKISLSLLSIALLAGCPVFQTGQGATGGTGPKSFDPYEGRRSGALKLSLLSWNGCSMLPWGQVVGKGDAKIPYPAKCPQIAGAPLSSSRPTTAPMPLIAGENYFLNQLTVIDTVSNVHVDPTKPHEPLDWMRTQTRFKSLDWEGAALVLEEWHPNNRLPGAFSHEFHYGNARWMNELKDDEFLVEVLDSEGSVVNSVIYPRRNFVSENWRSGHTKFAWTFGDVGPPEYPGDTRINPVVAPATFGTVRPPSFTTMAKFEAMHSSNPWLNFKVSHSLSGDGAIRVTWSELPDEPFYFPITFVHPSDLEAKPTCYSAEDPTQRVPCSFALLIDMKTTEPKNGEYFEPGEGFDVVFQLKDDNGNLLHPPEVLPSQAQAAKDQANGILYRISSFEGRTAEQDRAMVVAAGGPLQDLLPPTDSQAYPYFDIFGRNYLPSSAAMSNSVPGASELPGTSRIHIQLPEDARPGSWVMLVKAHRYYLGERTARTQAITFPVGQPEPTRYPQRVGNCQICHFGPTGLGNIRHGLNADHVESCKLCHSGNIPEIVHQIHMLSPKYPQKKNDCSLCHLSRESATKANYMACASCHQHAHGSTYFKMSLQDENQPAPNILSRCAIACHEANLPTQHLYPLATSGDTPKR